MKGAALVVASLLPSIAAMGIFVLLRGMRWKRRLLCALGVVVLTGPIAVALLFELVFVFYPNTRSPGVGVVAVPVTALSMLQLAIGIPWWVGLEIADLRRGAARREASEDATPPPV